MEFISYGIAYNRSNYVFIHRNGSIQTDMLCQLRLSIWNILCFFLPSYHSFHACVWVSSGLSAWLCVVQFDQYSQAYTTHTERHWCRHNINPVVDVILLLLVFITLITSFYVLNDVRAWPLIVVVCYLFQWFYISSESSRHDT